jgi:predicted DNA-binding transcriptional regulator YafY
MPKTKYAHARYLLINRELRRKSRVKTSDIRESIINELGFKISSRQVEKDIAAMRDDSFLQYYAPIEYDKREKAYYYTDRDFSIERFQLKEEEILALKFHAATLNQYRDYSLFKDFSSALKKVVEMVSINSRIRAETNSRLIIQTDNATEIIGIEYLAEIAAAIDRRVKVAIGYKKFEDEKEKERVISPYLLKEYKNRWYVIGKLDNQKNISTFALDRVTYLRVLEIDYAIDPGFDAENYFQHSFGITRSDSKPEKIALMFTPSQGNYIKTLKVHPSQNIISDTKKGLKIEILVSPCYELYEFIISQGANVKVISPKWLKTKIIQEHKKAIAGYQQ